MLCPTSTVCWKRRQLGFGIVEGKDQAREHVDSIRNREYDFTCSYGHGHSMSGNKCRFRGPPPTRTHYGNPQLFVWAPCTSMPLCSWLIAVPTKNNYFSSLHIFRWALNCWISSHGFGVQLQEPKRKQGEPCVQPLIYCKWLSLTTPVLIPVLTLKQKCNKNMQIILNHIHF